MEQKKLDEILEKHKLWISGEAEGECADLSDADLRGASLCEANLRGADLRNADLRGADLRGADLRGADLSGADLFGANLSDVDLTCANLRGTNLRDTNLSYADLRGANLSDADLRYANLENVLYDVRTAFFALQCPEKGSFVAYKKCDKYIVELQIPESAKRSSATTRKCRASEAKVIAIYNKDRTLADIEEIASNRDKKFIYKVGETVEVKNFDENRWNECSTGIHFFMTFDEAKNY